MGWGGMISMIQTLVILDWHIDSFIYDKESSAISPSPPIFCEILFCLNNFFIQTISNFVNFFTLVNPIFSIVHHSRQKPKHPSNKSQIWWLGVGVGVWDWVRKKGVFTKENPPFRLLIFVEVLPPNLQCSRAHFDYI